VNRALWELVAAGLATADGFDSLRALIDPRRKTAFQGGMKAVRHPRTAAGRWGLLHPGSINPDLLNANLLKSAGDLAADLAGAGRAQVERQEAEIESACGMLLRRYGVVFRDLLERESAVPRWRELLGMFRRLEARGTVRGGRFVDGFGGEQFALREAVESLREMRKHDGADGLVTVAAADPLNLVGIVVPGERPPAVPGKTVTYAGGMVCEAAAAASV
jgi:ATP-dependent Lhr-like helicase